MKLISLVRHGQASFRAQNYDQLSPKGIAQLEWLGDSFRQSRRQVHALLSGEMQRQQDSLTHFLRHYYLPHDGIELGGTDSPKHEQTARPLTQPTLLGTDRGFNEFDHEQVLFKAGLGFDDKASMMAFLAKQAKPNAVFIELFTQAMKRWQSGTYDEYDESWQGFLQRTWGGFQRVIAQTDERQHSMVFTSGGVIASIVQQVLQLTDQQALDLNWHIANASVHQFRVNDRGNQQEIFLQTFNEFSYLYPQGEQMVTWR